MKVLNLVCLFLCATSLCAQKPKIVIPGYAPEKGEFLIEGEEVNVSLEGAKLERLFITLRPKSKVERRLEIAVSAEGIAKWKPSAPGLVALEAQYLESSKEPLKKTPEDKESKQPDKEPSKDPSKDPAPKDPEPKTPENKDPKSQAPGAKKPESPKKLPKVEMTVSVAFASKFTIGLAIMILAGLLLFGGAAISIRALLRG